jgi:hypothetical protein
MLVAAAEPEHHLRRLGERDTEALEVVALPEGRRPVELEVRLDAGADVEQVPCVREFDGAGLARHLRREPAVDGGGVDVRLRQLQLRRDACDRLVGRTVDGSPPIAGLPLRGTDLEFHVRVVDDAEPIPSRLPLEHLVWTRPSRPYI